MSDSKPSPTENPEADSFLGRLSVVVYSLALLAVFVANANLPNPNTGQRELLDYLFGIPVLGWPTYLVIIYLSGRYAEVQTKCFKVFGKHLPVEKDAFLWMSPLILGFVVFCIFWLLWRILDAMK